MIDQETLTRWRELCEKATPGPWKWAGYVKGPMYLGSRSGVLGRTVMAFSRQGMRGAQPQFTDAEGLLQKAETYAVREVPYRDDIERLDHPDAEFLAAAREALPRLLAEVERLREIALDANAHADRLLNGSNEIWDRAEAEDERHARMSGPEAV